MSKIGFYGFKEYLMVCCMVSSKILWFGMNNLMICVILGLASLPPLLFVYVPMQRLISITFDIPSLFDSKFVIVLRYL